MTTDDLRTRAREAADEYYGDRGEIPLAAGAVRNARTEAFITGFIAHAAQQPTREQIARALHDDDLSGLRCLAGDERDCMEPYYRNADAVLALLDGAGS